MLFTVIICDKSVIKDCTNKYKIHLKPLLDSRDYAFCAWHPEKDTLKEAVPDLDRTIATRKEWRAVVLADSRSGVLDYGKSNPFDYAGYTRIDKSINQAATTDKKRALDAILTYRDYVREATEKSLSNPLMKLSVWLAGSAVQLRPSAPPADFLSVEPLSDEYEKVRAEYDGTVTDLEISLARAHRFDKICENFELSGDLFNPPKTIVAIAERAINTDLIKAASAWAQHTDYDYSNFIEDNMYSTKLRCLIYELPRVKGSIKENDFFNFLSTVMIIAQNDIASDILKFGRVYEISPEVDEIRMRELCSDYITKLRFTLKRIAELKHRHKLETAKVMNDAQAEKEFESGDIVPVELDKAYDKQTLMCDYDEIGLSKDCPGDEENYWTSQYREIHKRFNRFMRQPQRCLNKAIETDFRSAIEIDVAKVKRLTKYQRQDILIKLNEEEQSMLETRTSRVYDQKAYQKRLDDANRIILRGIAQRMTKRCTVIAALVPMLLLLIGFLPLFFSELNHLGTVTMSLLLTAVALAAALGCAGVMLLIFKRQTVDRFKHFNYEMSGIYNEVSGSLDLFSTYLSHARGFMKAFATLHAYDDQQYDPMFVFKKHEIDIENNIRDIMTLFSDYVDENEISDRITEPFSFDFTRPTTYSYEIPYHQDGAVIEYLQNGNQIMVPIDYITRICLEREELYD